MQIWLFAVGEGVRDRSLAGNSISLNANLAKCREGVKAERCEKTGTGARNRTVKTDTGSLKSRIDGRRFAMDKVKRSENASPTE